jgi:hypothetical protein
MKITLNLEKPVEPSLDFPKHSIKAYWIDDSRIGVVAAVQRQDGGFHLMQGTLDLPKDKNHG